MEKHFKWKHPNQKLEDDSKFLDIRKITTSEKKNWKKVKKQNVPFGLEGKCVTTRYKWGSRWLLVLLTAPTVITITILITNIFSHFVSCFLHFHISFSSKWRKKKKEETPQLCGRVLTVYFMCFSTFTELFFVHPKQVRRTTESKI